MHWNCSNKLIRHVRLERENLNSWASTAIPQTFKRKPLSPKVNSLDCVKINRQSFEQMWIKLTQPVYAWIRKIKWKIKKDLLKKDSWFRFKLLDVTMLIRRVQLCKKIQWKRKVVQLNHLSTDIWASWPSHGSIRLVYTVIMLII